jgi:hypothetical protein
MATKMRQSLNQFERAFLEETEADRVRREALRRQAVQRSRQRQVERVHKHGRDVRDAVLRDGLAPA